VAKSQAAEQISAQSRQMAGAICVAMGNSCQGSDQTCAPEPFLDRRSEFQLQYDRYTVRACPLLHDWLLVFLPFSLCAIHKIWSETNQSHVFPQLVQD
jgi:hypothetical protein